MESFVAMIMLAFLFYTLAIGSEWMIGSVKKWVLIVFVIGFACDLIGTYAMWQLADGRMHFHGYAGLAALLVMGLHLAWAVWTFAIRSVRAQKLFHAHSYKAWFLWIVAFLSGAMIHG